MPSTPNRADGNGCVGHGRPRFQRGNGEKVDRVDEGRRDVVDVEVCPYPTNERPFGGAVRGRHVHPDVEAFADANDGREAGRIDVDKVPAGGVGEDVVVVQTKQLAGTIPDGHERFRSRECGNFPCGDAVGKKGLEPKQRDRSVSNRDFVAALNERGFPIAVQFNGFE